MPDTADLDERLTKLRKVAKSVARHVFVVPLGADDAILAEKLKRFRVKSKIYIGKNMPSLPNETNASLASGVAIWDMQGLSHEHRTAVEDCFKGLADKIVRFFDDEEAIHGNQG